MSEARQTFGIHTEYIDLLQFLKATGIAATGGEAKAIVDEGLVTVNGEQESRRRRKLRPGDVLDLALDPAEAWVISEQEA
jgi:ribosome-associated protein